MLWDCYSFCCRVCLIDLVTTITEGVDFIYNDFSTPEILANARIWKHFRLRQLRGILKQDILIICRLASLSYFQGMQLHCAVQNNKQSDGIGLGRTTTRPESLG